MARSHGRILASIWSDLDFRRLSPEAQRAFVFLISQPNLNHAGLLPLTLRRWASAAAGLTVAAVQQALDELAAARFIVIDENTEEVLVRSLVRRDGIWKQPKVMLAMEGDAREIISPTLQATLLAELDRLDIMALSDEPGRTGESTRATVQGVVDRLREAFADAVPRVSGRVSDTLPGPLRNDPSGGSPEIAAAGSAEISSGQGEGRSTGGVSRDEPAGGDASAGRGSAIAIPDAKGMAMGIGNPHARAGARSPTPSPAPTPGSPEESGRAGARARRPTTDGRHPLPEDFTLTDAMRRWCVSTFGSALDIDFEYAQFVSYYRGEGTRKKSWPDAWQKWCRDSAKRASERSRRPPGGEAPPGGRRPSTTDARVAQAFDVAQRLAREEAPQDRKEITE